MKFDDIISGMKLEFNRTKKDKRKDEESPWTMQHGVGTVISKGPFLFALQDSQGRKVSITRNEVITNELQVMDLASRQVVVENKAHDYRDIPKNYHAAGHHWGEVLP